ncbi:hypothetical protein ACVL91_003093 [Bradyrhizobium elkanii]
MFIGITRMALIDRTAADQDLGQMVGDLDRLREHLARDQPVGGPLQFGEEVFVVGGEVAILPVQRDELVADLVAVFAGLLRDVFGILAVRGDPLAFGAEGIIDGPDQRGIVGREFSGGQVGRVVDLELEIATFQKDVVRLVFEPRNVDARAPHRPGVDLPGGQRRRCVRRVEIDERHLGAVDLVLLERRNQQEFAETRTVHRHRLADEILDLVYAGVIPRDDRSGARLVDHELREHQR